jgi:hypothetical protein
VKNTPIDRHRDIDALFYPTNHLTFIFQIRFTQCWIKITQTFAVGLVAVGTVRLVQRKALCHVLRVFNLLFTLAGSLADAKYRT